ncbi:flagellar hook protein [Granulicella sp. WH15]|uniref:flagellar filament capping protein FliD n=1 Tax=Granulicella sp. WH15 TaxID=2602070 RepID=UPI00136760C4|nr:flagellar filament capping protein FliD [Granulicella sp. WH15]QHN04052.1 flagellar hook protein [Granulicella sp. WH15]
MGTVGISFGSATSGAGFDVTSTVNSILAIQQGIETPWKTQLTTLAAQDTAFTQIGTDLATLSTSLSALTNFDGVLAQKLGSSSDENVLAITSASTSAVAGSHTITVTQLAQTSSVYTNEIANKGDTLSGTLTLQVGSGAAQTITLDSTNNTLVSLATAINTGNYGVQASVVTDANGSRLSLVSQTSGAGGQLSTTGSALTDSTTNAAMDISVGQTGQDAKLNVDGIDTTSGSNTVTNAIPGVTFQLLSAPVGAQVQVQITNDNSAIETAMQAVVTAYNTVASDLKTQEGNTSTGAAEPLFGDPTLSLIQDQLSSALFQGAASGSIKGITDLGLEVNESGQLTFTPSTMDAALNANFNDVAGFLQTAGSFGQSFTTTLNQMGNSSTTGAVSLALQQNSTEEAALNTNISNEETLIATQKTALTTELNKANETLQSIPSQLDEVNELYASFTGYNTNTGS